VVVGGSRPCSGCGGRIRRLRRHEAGEEVSRYAPPLPEGQTVRITTHYRSGHRAYDFAVPSGTAVRAFEAGVISETRQYDDFGFVSVLRGDSGAYYTHGHLSRFVTRAGIRVARGEVIARSGNTGSASSGPHLHFGAARGAPGFRGGEPFDPFAHAWALRLRSYSAALSASEAHGC
jgi:murein DD-endopeptidase